MNVRALTASVLILFSASFVAAQELPNISPPQKEHDWLKQFVGEWEVESEGKMAPDQPTVKCKGTMSSRMLGGFWVVTDAKSDMMGMKVVAVQTIGYDTQAKKYVGTWVDSMMNHMWHYQGTVDESGKKLVLEAEGPDFVHPGKVAKYRDSYEFKSKDHIEAISSAQGPDGKWVTFMTGQARRKVAK